MSVTERERRRKWFLIAKTYTSDINQLGGIWYGSTEDATLIERPERRVLGHLLETTRIRRFKVNSRRTQVTRTRLRAAANCVSESTARLLQIVYGKCHDVVSTASRLGKRLARSPLTMSANMRVCFHMICKLMRAKFVQDSNHPCIVWNLLGIH